MNEEEIKIEIKIIEDFLNYNKNKQISGIEISAISNLLKFYYNQQKEINFLKEVLNKLLN